MVQHIQMPSVCFDYNACLQESFKQEIQSEKKLVDS
jgi:hypothetical protein